MSTFLTYNPCRVCAADVPSNFVNFTQTVRSRIIRFSAISLRAGVLKWHALPLMALAISGCQTTTQSPTAAAPKAWDEVFVSPKKAVAIFEDVCGGSLPKFRSARSRMKKHGVTNVAKTGTVFSTKENLSIKIVDGPGFGKTCSLAFATKENRPSYIKATSKLGTFVQTPFGEGTLYQNRSVIVTRSSGTKRGSISYYNLKMLSERN